MKSDQNESVVRLLFDAIGRGDTAAFLSLLHEDVTWSIAPPRERSRRATKAALRDVGGTVSNHPVGSDLALTGLQVCGDHVAVVARSRSVDGAGAVHHQHRHLEFTIREGRVFAAHERLDPFEVIGLHCW